jgi:uncharacterized protein YwqG
MSTNSGLISFFLLLQDHLYGSRLNKDGTNFNTVYFDLLVLVNFGGELLSTR